MWLGVLASLAVGAAEWQDTVDITCTSPLECSPRLVSMPQETTGFRSLTFSYMAFHELEQEWTYEVDILCGPLLTTVGMLCGTTQGYRPCQTRYPSPVFDCAYAGPWAYSIVANTTEEIPTPLRLTGTVFGCGGKTCTESKSLDSWRLPVIIVSAAVAVIVIASVAYNRVHLYMTGGETVRRSRMEDTSSLTMLWSGGGSPPATYGATSPRSGQNLLTDSGRYTRASRSSWMTFSSSSSFRRDGSAAPPDRSSLMPPPQDPSAVRGITTVI